MSAAVCSLTIWGKVARYSTKFLHCFDKLMDLEGWDTVTDHPLDAGRKTRFGISQLAYPQENIDALDIARAMALYHRDYWEPLRCEHINDEGIAFQLFESMVHMDPPRRPRRSVKIAQGSLIIHGANVVFDGIMGPQTMGALNKYPHKASLLKWMNVLQGAALLIGAESEADFVEMVKARLGQLQAFGRGWGRRLEI